MFVREHTRYPVELAVRMKCSTWGEYLELHTSNLSRGGLFVPSAMSAPVGTEIAIELALPNGSMVKLRGEIVHLKEKSGDEPAGMGVMFMAMEDATKQALDEALRLAKASAPKPAMRAVPPSPTKAAPPAPIKAAPPAPIKAAPPAPIKAAPPAPIKAAPPSPIKAGPPSPIKAAPPSPPLKAVPPTAKAAPPPPPPTAAKMPAPLPPPPTSDGWDVPAAPAPEARAPKFADAVEHALAGELARRSGLSPHEQLGVAVDAADAAISEAHARLKERYAPSIFANYGAATSDVVLKINQAIDGAYRRLLDPSERRALVVAAHQPKAKEPTAEEMEQKRRSEQARNALRAGIDRRIEEACAHRDMGRLDEAIRTFEQVLQLDRKHEFARAELEKLRDLKAKRRR
ncbi:MAG TPA: PilZ domain-containing protein [Polyangia bacterium]